MLRKFFLLLTFLCTSFSLSPVASKVCHVVNMLPIPNEDMVQFSTGILPAADSTGHYILSFNRFVINSMLSEYTIPMEFKKPIIVSLIQLAQNGDNMGSEILKFYHDFVNCLI